jgi:hypothetical protein
VEYEADGRHVEILMAQLGLTSASKTVVTPGIKRKAEDVRDEELDSESAGIFKSAAMRLCYLAMDRPEIQFASKGDRACDELADAGRLGGPEEGGALLGRVT